MFSFSFLKAQRDLESIREVYTLLKEFSFFYIKANKYGCLQDAHFCCCIYFSVFCSTIPQKWRFVLSRDHKRDIVSKVVEFFLEINTVRIHQIDIYGPCRAPKTLGIITTVWTFKNKSQHSLCVDGNRFESIVVEVPLPDWKTHRCRHTAVIWLLRFMEENKKSLQDITNTLSSGEKYTSD
ncbi:hypothetical protein YC2023_093980 [Brassica napus]